MEPVAEGEALLASHPTSGPTMFYRPPTEAWRRDASGLALGHGGLVSSRPHIKSAGGLREHLPPQVAQGLMERGLLGKLCGLGVARHCL